MKKKRKKKKKFSHSTTTAIYLTIEITTHQFLQDTVFDQRGPLILLAFELRICL